LSGYFVKLDEPAALTVLGGFFGRGEIAFGKRDAALLRDDFDGFRKADVFDLLDEGEDVSGLTATEAVKELAGGVNGERGRFFAVEGAEAAVVLGSGFFQTHIFADDFDDIGLLLDGLGEVGHSEQSIRNGAQCAG
jgi:hypothetical protein